MPHMHGRNTQQSPHLTTSVDFITLLSLQYRQSLTPVMMVEESTETPQKTQAPVHDPISKGHHLLSVSFITCFGPDLCTALTTQNTTENNCIISNAHIMTAFQ